MSVIDPAIEPDGGEPEATLPALLRRPPECPRPPVPSSLRGLRDNLLKHPWADLDDESARTVAAGVVDVPTFRALVTVPSGGPTKGVSVLAEKAVTGGSLFTTPIHQRYVDLDVIPDLRNGRWGHLVRPATDAGAGAPPADYATLTGEDGEPLAALTVEMRDRAALVAVVKSSMIETFSAGPASAGVSNDYTDSVLQHGVKEPLLLFVLRVVYADSTSETFLMAGDGNSRLISLWKARTGGDLDTAARGLVANVLGGSMDRPHDPRRVRARVASMSERIHRGLGESTLTEQTVREGHTTTVPAVVVVGMRSDTPDRPLDLVAAKDDLIAGLHVNTTPWEEPARHDQGMHHVLRSAVERKLVTPEVATVLAGRADVREMATTLGLPAHPLWAAALWVEQMTGANWNGVRPLFKQAFSLGRARREPIGDRLGVVALGPFRSRSRDLNLVRAQRTFAGGGPLTDGVLHMPWSLTRGRDPVATLDAVRDAALGGDDLARHELTVLGGISAMMLGLLTRDRGSKLKPEARSSTTTPYRRSSYMLLAALVGGPAGIRTLHSIAVSFVRDDGSLPKLFEPDGSPSTDKAGAQISVEYEWDLFAVADPETTREAIAHAATPHNADDLRSEDEKLRSALADALSSALGAVRDLVRLQRAGVDRALGSPDDLRRNTKRARMIHSTLIQAGPLEVDEDVDEGEPSTDESGGDTS